MSTDPGISSPQVLVSGVVLGQPMSGVRRHNAELLPRVASLLEDSGGGLSVVEGAEPIMFALPSSVDRLKTGVPSGPVWKRAMLEGNSIRRLLSRPEGNFDLVHFGHLPVPMSLPIPFTLTVHDMRSIEEARTSRLSRAVAHRVHRSAVERAACVITVSDTIAADVIRYFGIEPARIRVVANAADHVEVLPRDVRQDAPILHVGHVERHKNLELLIRALSVDPNLPPLSLAGAPKGDEENRLMMLAVQLGVDRRVRFLGRFDDSELPTLYSQAACVALPSTIEGFGIVALEAQRAGVPLCVSGAGALTEVAGSHVPHFASDDPADCARAIQAALAIPASLLDEDRDRANRFTWSGSAERLCEAWRSAAHRGNS